MRSEPRDPHGGFRSRRRASEPAVEAPEPTVRIVTPVGEIDAHTAPHLRSAIVETLENARIEHLVVDLSRTSFLDSSALGVLVGALKRMREREGRLDIVLPSSHARRIFEITALDRVLTLHETRAGALAASADG
jgi:anti-sigma B factor antagonist